jgi:hypothetical protein
VGLRASEDSPRRTSSTQLLVRLPQFRLHEIDDGAIQENKNASNPGGNK